MRGNLDIPVKVTAEVGKFSSTAAEFLEEWQYPHFPRVGVFSVKTPQGHTIFFGVAMWRLEAEVSRKLKMSGGYTPSIPGIEAIGYVRLSPEETRGVSVTLAKDDRLKGMAWEIMLLPGDPWAAPGRSVEKPFEEWKTLWRERMRQVEEELSEVDSYWADYQPKKKKGAGDAEGAGDGEDVPAART